jgi:hypothetical protein
MTGISSRKDHLLCGSDSYQRENDYSRCKNLGSPQISTPDISALNWHCSFQKVVLAKLPARLYTGIPEMAGLQHGII